MSKSSVISSSLNGITLLHFSVSVPVPARRPVKGERSSPRATARGSLDGPQNVRLRRLSIALFGLGSEAPRLEIVWKEPPLPWSYVLPVIAASTLFEVLPYFEELVRGLRGLVPLALD
jgi:hypothetical protein